MENIGQQLRNEIQSEVFIDESEMHTVWRMWAQLVLLTVAVMFLDDPKEFLLKLSAMSTNWLQKRYHD